MLLQYVETGTFVVSPDSILALLQTAAMLQVEGSVTAFFCSEWVLDLYKNS